MQKSLHQKASPREETLSLLRLFAHSMPPCPTKDAEEAMTFFPGQPIAEG